MSTNQRSIEKSEKPSYLQLFDMESSDDEPTSPSSKKGESSMTTLNTSLHTPHKVLQTSKSPKSVAEESDLSEVQSPFEHAQRFCTQDFEELECLENDEEEGKTAEKEAEEENSPKTSVPNTAGGCLDISDIREICALTAQEVEEALQTYNPDTFEPSTSNSVNELGNSSEGLNDTTVKNLQIITTSTSYNQLNDSAPEITPAPTNSGMALTSGITDITGDKSQRGNNGMSLDSDGNASEDEIDHYIRNACVDHIKGHPRHALDHSDSSRFYSNISDGSSTTHARQHSSGTTRMRWGSFTPEQTPPTSSTVTSAPNARRASSTLGPLRAYNVRESHYSRRAMTSVPSDDCRAISNRGRRIPLTPCRHPSTNPLPAIQSSNPHVNQYRGTSDEDSEDDVDRYIRNACLELHEAQARRLSRRSIKGQDMHNVSRCSCASHTVPTQSSESRWVYSPSWSRQRTRDLSQSRPVAASSTDTVPNTSASLGSSLESATHYNVRVPILNRNPTPLSTLPPVPAYVTNRIRGRPTPPCYPNGSQLEHKPHMRLRNGGALPYPTSMARCNHNNNMKRNQVSAPTRPLRLLWRNLASSSNTTTTTNRESSLSRIHPASTSKQTPSRCIESHARMPRTNSLTNASQDGTMPHYHSQHASTTLANHPNMRRDPILAPTSHRSFALRNLSASNTTTTNNAPPTLYARPVASTSGLSASRGINPLPPRSRSKTSAPMHGPDVQPFKLSNVSPENVGLVQLQRSAVLEDNGVLTRTRYTARLNHVLLREINSILALNLIFERVIELVLDVQRHLRDLHDNAEMRIGVAIGLTSGLGNHFWVRLPFTHNITPADAGRIVKRIQDAIQSSDIVILDDFLVDVTSIIHVHGHAVIPFDVSFDSQKVSKRQLNATPNGRGCAFIALHIARAYLDKANATRALQSKNQTLVNAGIRIARAAGLEFYGDVRLRDFEILERTMNCRIFVFGRDTMRNKHRLLKLYTPKLTDRSLPLLCIGRDGTSYFPIKNMSYVTYSRDGQLRRPLMCKGCLEFFPNLSRHMNECPYICTQCHKAMCNAPDVPVEDLITCETCRRGFKDEECYRLHKNCGGSGKPGSSTCERVKHCEQCNVIVVKDAYNRITHNCNRVYCETCNESYIPNNQVHVCYIRKPRSKLAKQFIVTYFDIETYTCPDTKEMVPYVLVAQTICHLCSNEDSNDHICRLCSTDGAPRTRVFTKTAETSGPIESFVEYLLQLSNVGKQGRQNFNVYVLAHNNSKFDGQFIYRELLTNFPSDILSSDPLRRGNKIIQLHLGDNIFLKDTLLFTTVSLKKLPKVMGIPELSKSYFPYSFLTPDTLDYVGEPPERRYFNYDEMSPHEKNEFNDTFYNSLANAPYNIKNECIKYCIQDVTILRKCFEKFRHSFITAYEIDPIQNASTIASLCFDVFKRRFMSPNTIAIQGRTSARPYSYQAFRWLTYRSSIDGVEIRHARNGGTPVLRVRGKIYTPSGFAMDAQSGGRTVYMYYDCRWDGCCRWDCPNRSDDFVRNMSTIDRHTITVERESLFVQTFERVVTIWGCEWGELLDNDQGIRDRVSTMIGTGIDKRLQPGEALFGGRTNPFVLFHKIRPELGEEIHYLDFTSLYPSVQKKNPYPVGDKNILIGRALPTLREFTTGVNTAYFGLVYCTVLPPTDLYIPILPAVIDEKLTFTLCRTCAIDGVFNYCEHSDADRSLKGVYTTPELKLALDHGYKITCLFEIWQFRKCSDLFEGYVNNFLKDKVEASGYPRGVHTPQEQDSYIAEYSAVEGITLNKNCIEHNPGRRFNAKLALNSLWGKFAQNVRKGNTAIYSSVSDVFEKFHDARVEVLEVGSVGSSYIVRYNKTIFDERECGAVNIPIASFTTAYARVELWKLMNSLGERVLYCDTDSVVFVTRKELGETAPATGKFLGDLTDEIKDGYGGDAYGEAFVTLGPKTYGLRIMVDEDRKEYMLRTKGLTLGDHTARIVNFRALYEILRNTNQPYNNNNNNEELLQQQRSRFIRSIDGQPLNHPLVLTLDTCNELAAVGTRVAVPTTIFQAGRYGGVKLQDSTKCLRYTYRKRMLIPGTDRTVPYGFRSFITML